MKRKIKMNNNNNKEYMYKIYVKIHVKIHIKIHLKMHMKIHKNDILFIMKFFSKCFCNNKWKYKCSICIYFTRSTI